MIKRFLGNAKAIAASVMIASTAALGMAPQAVPSSAMVRPDVLEVSTGEAKVTKRFSRWGWNAAHPVNLDLGDDLYDASGMCKLVEWIDRCKPRLVILTCPPKVWSSQHKCIGGNSQAVRRQQRESRRHASFFQLSERVFERQIGRGDDALVETPATCASDKSDAWNHVMSHPEVFAVLGSGSKCTAVRARDQLGFRGSALWLCTSIEVCHEIAQTYLTHRAEPGSEGRKHVCDKTAAAICRGYVKTLKCKEPSRIRRMLRQVAARIRRTDQGELIKDLRWNEKNIAKALSRWNAVFAVGSHASENRDTDQPMAPPLEDSDDDELLEDVPMGDAEGSMRSRLAYDGISFDIPVGRKLSPEVREGLKKAHCNLGHPGTKDLQRFLKLGGARQEVVEAAGWIRCVSCAHSSKPRTHRTTSIPPCSITFGDEIHLDCICVHDSNADAHWYMSILDRATSYHIIELLRDHSPSELNKAFDRAWTKWAGPPLRVSVDFEGGFRGKDFWNKVGEAGASLVSIAGTAHWQAGKVERHNQTIKDMLRTVIRQTGVKGREEMKKVAREVSWAKNTLTREHGWSPVALVFGKEPRVFGELHSQGEPHSFHPRVGDEGSDVAKRMRYRYHAKIEYIRSQARHMLARTAHNRVRKMTNPQIGQLVFFWRAMRRKEPSRWVGPAYIVGLQGNNAWVAIGGRCFLVAGEHLREACGDERHFGDPQIQKAIALFRRLPSDATYEDLTSQENPSEEPMEIEQQPLVQDVAGEVGDLLEGIDDLPDSLKALSGQVGMDQR